MEDGDLCPIKVKRVIELSENFQQLNAARNYTELFLNKDVNMSAALRETVDKMIKKRRSELAKGGIQLRMSF